MSSSTLTSPKRGGTHPIFVTYLGGAPLDSGYCLISADTYSSTSQLRSIKGLQMAETQLHSHRDSTTSLKFNGKLDVTDGEVATLTELNMEAFLRSVSGVIERFGLETFFYLKGSDSKMKYLPEEPHTFTLNMVIAEHKQRTSDPTPIMDALNPTVETPRSIATRFATYDAYEKCDFALSRLAIESLVHPDLRAEVVVQHSHVDNFKKLPGQVYLMMVLEVCHASFSYKMDEAADKLTALQLSDFPGENISKFANESQRLIKIMQGGYSLPYQLGSTLLRKVCMTQSDP